MSIELSNDKRVKIQLESARINTSSEEWTDRLKAYQKIDIIAHKYNRLIAILTEPETNMEEDNGETQDG